MDVPRAAMRLSAAVAVASIGLLVVLSLAPSPAAAAVPVTARDGGEFHLPDEPGVYEAQWRGTPVLVFVVRGDVLDGVDRLRGEEAATPSRSLPSGLSVFALSAKSTDMGCTVGFVGTLGASKDVPDYDGDGAVDGRVMDPCHHAQWDAFHRGAPLAGTPADGRLAALRLEVRGGSLLATGFDGPVGPR